MNRYITRTYSLATNYQLKLFVWNKYGKILKNFNFNNWKKINEKKDSPRFPGYRGVMICRCPECREVMICQCLAYPGVVTCWCTGYRKVVKNSPSKKGPVSGTLGIQVCVFLLLTLILNIKPLLRTLKKQPKNKESKSIIYFTNTFYSCFNKFRNFIISYWLPGVPDAGEFYTLNWSSKNRKNQKWL